MKSRLWTVQPFCNLFIAVLAVVGSTLFCRTASAQSAHLDSCSAPEYRQFDFWVGDWDTVDFDHPGARTAHVRVERILGGCVLKETYEGANGLYGESFSIYDRTRSVWHQTWVSNQGQLLMIEGTMQTSGIVLIGADRTADGRKKTVRGTWTPVDGGVRETAVVSTDSGHSWTPWFDLLFRPHTSTSRAVKPIAAPNNPK
jgi:hypothetical protein